MGNRVILVQNVAGGLSRSNIVKVGLGDAINMYPETQDLNEHSTQLLMRSVDGEVPFAEELDGVCRGLYRVSRGRDETGNVPALYGVFGHKLYLFDADGKTYEIATIESTNTECRMVETGGYNSAHPHLVIVDGFAMYAVDTTIPIASQRTDFRTIELPVKPLDESQHIRPSHIAYLYGYLVCNDEGTDAFYTSIQYPFETTDTYGDINYDIWRLSTTNNIGFITFSEWSQDNTTALCSNGSKLYTFGPRSWQAFSFNDDKNNPFSSPDNAAGNIGIKAVNSLCMLGHTTIWLGSSDIGENAVFMLQDTQLTRISTGDVERELAQMVHPENAYSSIWQEHRHVFYSLTFEDSKLTYVYDVTENKWHRRASYDISNNLTFWRYNHATFAYNRTMVASGNTLCYMDEHVFHEHDGRKILKLRRGGVLTSNDQPFFIDSLELICNNGQQSTRFSNLIDGAIGQPTDGELNPRVSVRYTWDGGNFSDYEDYYLGKVGDYGWQTTMWHLGFGKFFTIEISTTEEIPFAIENMKVAWSPAAWF